MPAAMARSAIPAAFRAAVFAVLLQACASSYCGAPCDTPPAPPAAPADVHVNQYGSIYGYLEVDSLTPVQLNIEKNSLEFLLKADPKDAEILKALKAEGDSAYAYRYGDYSTGGNRFDASGKLRRRGTTEAGAQRIARLIGESQSRELFERYRQLRWRMIQQARTAALAPPAPAAAPPPADTSWSGGYRLGSDTLIAAPERFPSADSCAQWAARAAEGFRHKAYGFEFECRQGSTVIKRRLW
jgi:hypothetical protein